MPALSAYDHKLDYSYAPGLFPAMECLLHRPNAALRVLVSSKGRDGADKLITLAEQLHVRVEEADRALSRISGKENCFAAAVFQKFSDDLMQDRPHLVLHEVSDGGNIGTMLRTALGFGLEDVALIRPCADPFDPRTVRASMGSLFSLRLHVYDCFEEYRRDHPTHTLYPFMLDSSRSLPDVVAQGLESPWSLIVGHEGHGLPPVFAELGQAVRIPSNDKVDSLNVAVAAAIGMYAMTQGR